MFPWSRLYVNPHLGLRLNEMVPHPYWFNECHQGKDANLPNLSFVKLDEERLSGSDEIRSLFGNRCNYLTAKSLSLQ